MKTFLAFKNYDFSTPALIPDYSESWYVALGQTRSLGRLGVPVYGSGKSRGLPSEFSRYLRKFFYLEPAQFNTEEQTLNSLIVISQIIGRKPVLLISLDPFAKFAAKHKDILDNHFIMPRLDANVVEGLCDKKRTHVMALENGLPTVKTGFPESIEDVNKFSREAIFPVIMKATDWSNFEKRPPNILSLLKSPDELIREYRQVSRQTECPNVILQEYIHGDGSQEWIFHGYFDAQSRCLLSFTGKKLRQVPIFGGITSLGMCSNNEQLKSMSINFLRAIGYSGIVDIDYIYDDRDGLYKVLDVNPRIGANFRIFVGENGLDVARAMYIDLTGQPVPQDNQVEGHKWIVEDRDLLSVITAHRNGSLGLRDWVKSLRGVKEGAWFALDDPLPFFKQGFHHLSQIIKGIRS